MSKSYKPNGYNSASPYLLVEDTDKFVEFMMAVFDAKELRKYHDPKGSIVHAELKIDDSVVMYSESNEKYPASSVIVHVYVADVDKTFEKAIKAGGESIGDPAEHEGDPDRRGTFKGPFGNIWSVSTQLKD